MNNVEPNDNHKLLGFVIQILGFALVWNALNNLYYINMRTQFKIGNWVYSQYPPLWYFGLICLGIIGIFVVVYGILIYCKIPVFEKEENPGVIV